MIEAWACTSNCVGARWDFIELQLPLMVLLWVLFLIFGLVVLFVCSKMDLTERKHKVGGMRESKAHFFFYTALGLLQYGIFWHRALSKSFNIVSVIFELIAAVAHLCGFTLAWFHAFLSGWARGFRFMFGWAIVDCLLISSIIVFSPLAEIDGRRTWFSASFLSSLKLVECWSHFLIIYHVNLKVLKNMGVSMCVRLLLMIVSAGTMMMTLENLGDPELIRPDTQWNAVSSIYYVISVTSTVGYRGLAPSTVVARAFGPVVIFGGLATLAGAASKVQAVLALRSTGGGSYVVRNSVARHIVIAGNPTAQMVLDFLTELFHPDHAEEAEDLHAVVLLPYGNPGLAPLLAHFELKENLDRARFVHIFHGSPTDPADLERVSASSAAAFFVLPNMLAGDEMVEDNENIIRMLNVRRTAPDLRIVLLILKGDHRELISHAMSGKSGSLLTCIAADQFKLELIGKTCQVPGFSTLICNLCKTVAPAEGEERGQQWQEEYNTGLANELYEVEISPAYIQCNAVFSEVFLDVLRRTDGTVYLVGLVETQPTGKQVLVNPGPFHQLRWYDGEDMVPVATKGIFIAPDLNAIIQCPYPKGDRNMQEIVVKADCGQKLSSKERKLLKKYESQRPMREAEEARMSAEMDSFVQSRLIGRVIRPEMPEDDEFSYKKGLSSKSELDEAKIDITLLQGTEWPLTYVQQVDALKLVSLARKSLRAQAPARPPASVLAKGGHIVFLCVGSSADGAQDVSVGLKHFVWPLRAPHVAERIPIVVVAPCMPRDWKEVVDYKEVFFFKGSPTSFFDLRRVNATNAHAVFLCHVDKSAAGGGGDAWIADADVVCCTRLIESNLETGSKTKVIAELSYDANCGYIPLPIRSEEPRRRRKKKKKRMTLNRGATGLSGTDDDDTRSCSDSESETASCYESEAGTSDGGAMQPTYTGTLRRLARKISKDNSELYSSTPLPYYHSPRFACSQLYIGGVVTALTANTFYNHSLAELVVTMVDSQVIYHPTPTTPMKFTPQANEGKYYFDYMQDLLWYEGLLVIAIVRQGTAGRRPSKQRPGEVSQRPQRRDGPIRKQEYVYTAPPACGFDATKVRKDDRCICFAAAPPVPKGAPPGTQPPNWMAVGLQKFERRTTPPESHGSDFDSDEESAEEDEVPAGRLSMAASLSTALQAQVGTRLSGPQRLD